MVDTSKCITVLEFANKAGISRQAVNKMIKQGRIKAELFGKTYLIDKQELVKYLAAKVK
jgi:excisionase family DNA binding protein